ncbi:MAG: hypothetical protein JW840_00190 [Candidatus Thermoplasmatota archaeon]|nr:hypothetical protein [Candidatus Thermoplasmatota archaeon]
MRTNVFPIGIIVLFGILFLSGCMQQQDQSPDTSSPLQFTVATPLPDARVGEFYRYSFCKPDCLDENDLCGSDANPSTNPAGGSNPYHFQLESGSGFPPIGLVLHPNGLLEGTPGIAGEKTFTVCAVDLGGNQCCVPVSLNVLEARINVSPNDVLVKGSICFDAPCEVSTTVRVTSAVPWHVQYVTGSGTTRCFDPVEEFSRSWSLCPNQGDPGETIVTLSTMMYGEATPSYYDYFIIDRGSTIRFEAVDDPSNYAELSIALALPYYEE